MMVGASSADSGSERYQNCQAFDLYWLCWISDESIQAFIRFCMILALEKSVW